MAGPGGIDPHWLWLAAGLLLATAEAIAPGFFLIWLAAAALVTGLTTWLVPMAFWAQVVLFAELALAAVLIARRWLSDHPGEAVDPLINDRIAQMLGQTVVVTQAIVAGEGRVHQADGEWPARGPDAPPGTRVRIIGHDGVVLLVQPVDDDGPELGRV